MAAFYMSEELVGILRQEGAAFALQTQVAQLDRKQLEMLSTEKALGEFSHGLLTAG